jgi:hypothetical protein
VDEVVLGHLVLDQGHQPARGGNRRRDAEQVEVRLVARVVDAGDHLGGSVLLLGQLRDDQIVLVVTGEGGDHVGRPRDAGPLEHVDLGRVAEHHLMLELVLEPLETVTPLLDQRHLVLAVCEKDARKVGADLAASRDEDVHQ